MPNENSVTKVDPLVEDALEPGKYALDTQNGLCDGRLYKSRRDPHRALMRDLLMTKRGGLKTHKRLYLFCLTQLLKSLPIWPALVIAFQPHPMRGAGSTSRIVTQPFPIHRTRSQPLRGSLSKLCQSELTVASPSW